MGHFSVLTVQHDNIHEIQRDDRVGDKIHSMIQLGKHYPDIATKRGDRLPGIALAYSSHADYCPVIAFSHGYTKGVLGSLTIPRHDDKTLDDYLIEIAKQRGFVIYKKGEK